MHEHHLQMRALDVAATWQLVVCARPRSLYHNARMPTDADTDKRLTDLEVKASFSEELLDHLNDLVARQQEQIDLLIREVGKLKDRAPDTGGGASRDPREDLPPHY